MVLFFKGAINEKIQKMYVTKNYEQLLLIITTLSTGIKASDTVFQVFSHVPYLSITLKTQLHWQFRVEEIADQQQQQKPLWHLCLDVQTTVKLAKINQPLATKSAKECSFLLVITHLKSPIFAFQNFYQLLRLLYI